MALLNELDYKMDLLKVTYFFRVMASLWGTKYRFIDNQKLQSNLMFLSRGLRIGGSSGYLIQERN